MNNDMSITYTVGKAVAYKQIRMCLLIGLISLIGYNVVADKSITISQRKMTNNDLVLGKDMQESAKISTSLYLAGRFGNVDLLSIDELKTQALNMVPYAFQQNVSEGIDETKLTLRKSKVTERFVARSAKYYEPLNRVWVTGEKYVFVPNENPRFIQWTYEFDLVLKNLRIFPERIVQYQGTPKDTQQITKYLEERND